MQENIEDIIDQQIFSGRQAKGEVDSLYYASRGKIEPKEFVPELQKVHVAWQKQTLAALKERIADFYLDQFIHAQPSIGLVEGNIQWNAIRNKLQAQLDELVSLRKSLEQKVGGINVSISGDSNKTLIGSTDNSINTQTTLSNLDALFLQQYNKPDKDEVLQMLQEFREVVERGDTDKVRGVGGSLLAKVSEFSQIASLVLQTIQFFS